MSTQETLLVIGLFVLFGALLQFEINVVLKRINNEIKALEGKITYIEEGWKEIKGVEYKKKI